MVGESAFGDPDGTDDNVRPWVVGSEGDNFGVYFEKRCLSDQ